MLGISKLRHWYQILWNHVIVEICRSNTLNFFILIYFRSSEILVALEFISSLSKLFNCPLKDFIPSNMNHIYTMHSGPRCRRIVRKRRKIKVSKIQYFFNICIIFYYPSSSKNQHFFIGAKFFRFSDHKNILSGEAQPIPPWSHQAILKIDKIQLCQKLTDLKSSKLWCFDPGRVFLYLTMEKMEKWY